MLCYRGRHGDALSCAGCSEGPLLTDRSRHRDFRIRVIRTKNVARQCTESAIAGAFLGIAYDDFGRDSGAVTADL
ncbi:hypothetical protein NIIDMKKI_52150 [Mycobacterium kansasii]|uniref:Uncharacterized protein n=1 Tax=Mycobacterium kansasii TaxID=1768 RepID=A0A7G1IJS3_MYCKA|nr:hypothetical protein NIIDMKKI_52150 [Mycobacterium kansasii]